MCDTERRCDRPSCPCNEPDTELKDALTRMQERFPAPWSVYLGESISKPGSWLASAEFSDVSCACYGPTPHAAVDAAIKAWDAAVKADALFKPLKTECEAWRAWNDEARRSIILPDSIANPEPYRVKLVAARAATDKAGALR